MEYPVIITYANDGYYNFAKNMLISLDRQVKHHRVHFYCLDINLYEKINNIELNNIKLTTELVNTNVSSNFEGYGSLEYNMITHTKMNILKNALERFNFIHFIDCDVVCMKEPTLEHYKKYSDYDIVFQYDAGMYSPDKLHSSTLHHIWTCTGNVSLRNTPGTHYILNKIIEYQHMYTDKNDQDCLYQYFRDLSIVDIREYPHAKLFTYEVDEYTNGYWLDNDIGTLENTYFFHANHVNGVEPKLNLLKKANQYFI